MNISERIPTPESLFCYDILIKASSRDRFCELFRSGVSKIISESDFFTHIRYSIQITKEDLLILKLSFNIRPNKFSNIYLIEF